MRAIVLLAALALACSCARQRAWVEHTATTLDDAHPKLARASFDEIRRLAIKGGSFSHPQHVYKYAQFLAIYLWEVEPLLAARAESKGRRDPPAISGLDRAQLVAELKARIQTYEAEHGYDPGARFFLEVARKDCDAVSARAALMSCGQRAELDVALGYVNAVCEGPEKFLRALHDMSPAHEHHATVIFHNPSEKAFLFGEAKPDTLEGLIEPVTIGPGETVRLKLARCSIVRFRPADVGMSWDVELTEPVTGIRQDKNTIEYRLITPEELATLEP